MISHLMRGRLGNQMFQYACLRALQLKYYPNESINIDFSELKKLGTEEEGFCDSLKDFNVEPFSSRPFSPKSYKKAILFALRIPNALLRIIGFRDKADQVTYRLEKRIQPFLNEKGIYYMIHGYCSLGSSSSKEKFSIGNYESAKYFESIRPLLLEEFTPIAPPLEKNKSLYELIESKDSVCVSIRRGDFVDDDDLKRTHFVCGHSYFDRAIKEMSQRLVSPVFIVFSDDINWVKENMTFPGIVAYEDGNDPVWEKLRMMYSCSHFVLSNSTFSWWAQYLCRNEEKIVIAPSVWKNISYKPYGEKLDIYQNEWILIDPD